MKRFRGHPMARAGLELALWDLKAKKLEIPLHRLYRGTREEIPVGVSIGIQDSIPDLLQRISEFLSLGYQRVKIKIAANWDVDVCAQVRREFPQLKLQVDANGDYSLEDIPHLKQLDDFDLLMLEQPFPPYDLLDHSRLQEQVDMPVCLDESIPSLTASRQAIEMESCRIINIKVGRVGGIVEARKIHDICLENRIPVWCGGMLESGVGRAHNVHLATLPNFLFPHDISASKRYYVQDIVEPAFDITSQGNMEVPQGPGIGVEPQEDRIKKATIRFEVFTGK